MTTDRNAERYDFGPRHHQLRVHRSENILAHRSSLSFRLFLSFWLSGHSSHSSFSIVPFVEWFRLFAVVGHCNQKKFKKGKRTKQFAMYWLAYCKSNLPLILLLQAEIEMRFFNQKCMLNKQITLDRHGPRPSPKICLLLNSPCFSFPTTFK
jgi:hypothetical protein